MHIPKENVEPEQRKHNGEVTENSDGVAQLVNQQEPFIHHPVKRHTDRSFTRNLTIHVTLLEKSYNMFSK